MKLWHILGGITLSMALAACADRSQPGVSSEAGAPPIGVNTSQSSAISLPSVTGTVNIRQRIALPPNAALTVTVSDASLADAPSKVITQRVTRTGGKQAPFTFVLPYSPTDIQPKARILLSAAITIDNRVVMVTENVVPVITNGVNSADLIMTPVTSVPLPAQGQSTGTSVPAPLTAQPSQPAW